MISHSLPKPRRVFRKRRYGNNGDISLTGSYSGTTADYEGVTRQAGVHAGEEGFTIRTGGGTTLTGAVIASTADAGKNTLDTAWLVTKDLENKTDYAAASLSGGIRYQAGDNFDNIKTLDAKGLAGTTPMAGAAFDKDTSVTHSAVAAGTVTIRDDAAQLAKTGLTVSETLAGLNRDTADAAGALANNFDREKVAAAMAITANLARETGTFVENQAKLADLKSNEAAGLRNHPGATPAERAWIQPTFAHWYDKEQSVPAARWKKHVAVMNAALSAAGKK